MSEILITTAAVVALLVGLAALVVLVRRDGFAGPGQGYLPHDELGPLSFRRRPV